MVKNHSHVTGLLQIMCWHMQYIWMTIDNCHVSIQTPNTHQHIQIAENLYPWISTRNSSQIHRCFCSVGKADRKGLILDNQQIYLQYTPENSHVNGTSPFLIGDTSSNGCFFHCHLSFRGCKWHKYQCSQYGYIRNHYWLVFIWMCLGHWRVEFLSRPYASPVVSVSSSFLTWRNTCLTNKLQKQWRNMNVIKLTQMHPNHTYIGKKHWEKNGLSCQLYGSYWYETLHQAKIAPPLCVVPQFLWASKNKCPKWMEHDLHLWVIILAVVKGRLRVAYNPQTQAKVDRNKWYTTVNKRLFWCSQAHLSFENQNNHEVGKLHFNWTSEINLLFVSCIL